MHWSDKCGHATVARMSASLPGRIALLWLVIVTAQLQGACGSHQTATRRASVPRARSWAEVFAHPTEVTVETFVTGHASGDRRMVLDPEDPNIRHLSNPFEPSAV